jgi:hypothetical protein
MVDACFRHQHPEAFGGEAITEPSLPQEIRYGQEDYAATGFPAPALAEEPMGHPEAVA